VRLHLPSAKFDRGQLSYCPKIYKGRNIEREEKAELKALEQNPSSTTQTQSNHTALRASHDSHKLAQLARPDDIETRGPTKKPPPPDVLSFFCLPD
jgi:hypothetical protein